MTKWHKAHSRVEGRSGPAGLMLWLQTLATMLTAYWVAMLLASHVFWGRVEVGVLTEAAMFCGGWAAWAVWTAQRLKRGRGWTSAAWALTLFSLFLLGMVGPAVLLAARGEFGERKGLGVFSVLLACAFATPYAAAWRAWAVGRRAGRGAGSVREHAGA